MESGIRLVLQGMGVDLKDENFKDTPRRVARLYEEILTPNSNNWTSFSSKTKGMVVLRGHRVTALCPHHLMPVELRCYVGYVPKKRVLGLSKLARIVEEHLTRPIMQEELGDLVADSLFDANGLNAQGVAVVLTGKHGCMRYRGVETEGDVVTSTVRGLFMHSDATRDEFLRIIGTP